MSVLIDLTGKEFGRLTVLYLDRECMEKLKGVKYKKSHWVCECICGNRVTVSSGNLKRKNGTKSCGCLQRDNVTAWNKEKSQINAEKLHAKYDFNGTVITTLTQKISKNNKTGVKGVHYNGNRNKFIAEIMFQRKKIHLGYFEKLEDAASARAAAEEQYFKPIIEEFKELKQMEG